MLVPQNAEERRPTTTGLATVYLLSFYSFFYRRTYVSPELCRWGNGALGALGVQSSLISRTSRAGGLRSTPSGPDDWDRVAGKLASLYVFLAQYYLYSFSVFFPYYCPKQGLYSRICQEYSSKSGLYSQIFLFIFPLESLKIASADR